ncbi:MAG: hypothetical protein V5A23_04195 [Halobacteriales archaeon]
MDSEQRPVGEGRYERYGTRETDDGRVVVYDEREEDAWVQSDVTIEQTR